MSKRTDSIRSMFSAPQREALSADNKSRALPRVSSGSVRSIRETFSGVERENEELRSQLASGQVAIELDPNVIDPSPLADRFTDQEVAPFEALKASISERGQEIPILVREHPEIAGRYQSAYGHRRVRAARELGIQVRAYVRTLTDEDLVVAQGIENSAREDLSFIERAFFAVRLEDRGFQRSLIQTALSVDRAEVSKLVSVARAVPADLIEAIGRAPKVGRGRWQALADAVKEQSALKRARSATQRENFVEQSTDVRFLTVLSAANKSNHVDAMTARPRLISSRDGDEIARVALTDTHLKLTVSRISNEGFAAFVVDQLPDLFEAYAKTVTPEDDREP
jgi:ParB family chromosome partitioning protein